MNAQEERGEIIKTYLPKLIKELTHFEDDDENLKRCEQFAFASIRNQRYMSTNSHNIKRKIDGIREKFVAENCIDYAQHFVQLCEEMVQHPLCVEHYEVDVHWSLLDFLISLAYNPGGNLRRNKHNLVLKRALGSKVEPKEKPDISYWQELLQEDCIPLAKKGTLESDLSDWSEDNSEGLNESNGCKEKPSCEPLTEKVKSKLLPPFDKIQPPRKITPYTPYDGSEAEQELLQQVQHSWWLNKKSSRAQHMPIESNLNEANTAHIYIEYLRESSHNLLHFDEPDTATEYCLLREIIWMFQVPENCKFFQVSNDSIKMRRLVTLPSVIENSLVNYMQQYFLPYIEMMRTLLTFTQSFYKGEVAALQPKTLECYAANLRTLLQPFWRALLSYEQRLIKQEDFEIHTLIGFQQEMAEPFNLLYKLHALHMQVVLCQKPTPAHISSVYLLTSLLQQHQSATNNLEANLAMSLFLTAVKVYCAIIDTWWTEGRLDDWQREFLVERLNQSSQVVRPFKKNKETSFFVATNVAELIHKSEFFHILHEYVVEAGSTLNLLYELNRIGDMRNLCANTERSLYTEFMQEVMTNVKKLHTETAYGKQFAAKLDTIDCAQKAIKNIKSKAKEEDLLQFLSTKDEFLLQAFGAYESDEDSEVDKDTTDSVDYAAWNALQIFEYLQRHSQGLLLPIQELVLNTIKRLLEARITFANAYVLQLYRLDFQLQRHQQNLRRVLLLEASDLMYHFYEKLFKQIEKGETWANPFQLTTQLDEILSSKFPEMSTLFRVEIKSLRRCQTKRVCEAVEELTISYNLSLELAQAIDDSDMTEYNKIFRFLLKVKWALHTLEELHFATTNKRRPAYAPFEYIDLLVRRLQMLRFWMLYSIQSIHAHLMTHVLQAMGEQLDEKLALCVNFKQMKNLHATYVRTVCEHCFLTENLKNIKLGVEQFLNLVNVLRTEWNYCLKYIESQHPLAPELSAHSEDSTLDLDYIANSQIDDIEVTYIQFHLFLAKTLNDAVYLQQHTFLSGLSAAFNGSLPQ